MWPILIALLFGLAIIGERAYSLINSSSDTDQFFEDVKKIYNDSGKEQAIEFCENSPGPVASIFYAGLSKMQKSKEEIEKTISKIEDPAGHNYKVHHGPLQANAALSVEEMQSIAMLGPTAEAFPQLSNPYSGDSSSVARGEELFIKNCAKCHGESGNGYGPVTQGFTTWPRQLWAWHKTGPETDGYIYWFITNGRSDMPPWGVILSEKERWDLVSYVKTLKPPSSE